MLARYVRNYLFSDRMIFGLSTTASRKADTRTVGYSCMR
jgi:hypothetical protein